jgi:AcrR family transcriptional regulator
MSIEPKTEVKPKSAYHHGDLRKQLIAAVRELVEAHGPDGFSVSQAARKAGVSTAAPYKHFKDRDEILRGVVSEAMDRLHANMAAAAESRPHGSLETVAAIGQAYVDFARAEPGVFRLVFGLTEGHENAPELHDKGEACFGVVAHAAADYLGLPVESPVIQRRAYMLWTCVHGHSFLIIDQKYEGQDAGLDDWDYLMEIAHCILGASGPRASA